VCSHVGQQLYFFSVAVEVFGQKTANTLVPRRRRCRMLMGCRVDFRQKLLASTSTPQPRREHAESGAEPVADGGESEDEVEVRPHRLREPGVQPQLRCRQPLIPANRAGGAKEPSSLWPSHSPLLAEKKINFRSSTCELMLEAFGGCQPQYPPPPSHPATRTGPTATHTHTHTCRWGACGCG